MNRKLALKIFVDAVMLILYIQLMFFYGDNPLYHEIAGIAIGVVCIVHLVLNAKMTTGLARKCTSGKKMTKPRFQMAMDIALLATMVATIVTGLLVARELFVGPGGLFVATLHNTVSYVCLGVIAVHLLQHAKYLVGVFKTKKSARQAPPAVYADHANRPVHAPKMQTRRDFVKGSLAAGVGTFALVSTAFIGAPKIFEAAFANADTTKSNEDGAVASTSETNSSQQQPANQSAATDQGAAPDATQPSTNGNSSISTQEPAETATNSSGSSAGQQESVPQESTGSDAASAQSEEINLSSIICPVCRKACPVSNLRCQRGVQWAQTNGYL